MSRKSYPCIKKSAQVRTHHVPESKQLLHRLASQDRVVRGRRDSTTTMVSLGNDILSVSGRHCRRCRCASPVLGSRSRRYARAPVRGGRVVCCARLLGDRPGINTVAPYGCAATVRSSLLCRALSTLGLGFAGGGGGRGDRRCLRLHCCERGREVLVLMPRV